MNMKIVCEKSGLCHRDFARRPGGGGSICALHAHSPRAGSFNPLVLSVLRSFATQNVSKDADFFFLFSKEIL